MPPFTILPVEQRSDEWRAARAGRLTGSRAADMLATIKTGEAAARRNLRLQLVLERLTGRPQERGYVSAAMQDGIEREADAAAAYELLTGSVITSTGFLQHDHLLAGCSLDGHVSGPDGAIEGVIEIKCPLPATHLEYLRTGRIPHDYAAQVLHALWLTGARWCDWLSFHPDFPEPLRVKLVRVPRDEAAVAEYDTRARAFLAEVDRDVEALRTMAAAGVPA